MDMHSKKFGTVTETSREKKEIKEQVQKKDGPSTVVSTHFYYTSKKRVIGRE